MWSTVNDRVICKFTSEAKDKPTGKSDRLKRSQEPPPPPPPPKKKKNYQNDPTQHLTLPRCILIPGHRLNRFYFIAFVVSTALVCPCGLFLSSCAGINFCWKFMAVFHWQHNQALPPWITRNLDQSDVRLPSVLCGMVLAQFRFLYGGRSLLVLQTAISPSRRTPWCRIRASGRGKRNRWEHVLLVLRLPDAREFGEQRANGLVRVSPHPTPGC